jgi:hypothetical protein
MKPEVKMSKPMCPNCGQHDFVHSPVPMPNDDYWNPIICKACGAVVGQLPSNDEREAIKRLAKISTIEEYLSDIKSLLLGFEQTLGKKSC